MSDTPEKRAERAWRTIWRDANGHIADSFPYKPEEDDVILPEIRSAEAVVRKELIQEISPLLEYMRNPLEASLQGLKPSADVPPNVDVCWHTSSDAVAGLLKLMDTYKRALAGEEGE